MEHIIIKDPTLKGREYGTLSSFQEAIQKITAADEILLPELGFWEKYFLQVSKWRFLRKFIRKRKIVHNTEKIDVLWYILMGPENYRLDLFKGYENVPVKIIYFFDTLPHQFYLIKKLKIHSLFNYQITSFNDAVVYLNKITNSNWYFVQQASSIEYMYDKDLISKEIAFSSFGRSDSKLNNVIQKFCDKNNLIFYRTHELGGKILTNNKELYKSYCWALSNSVFNVSLSVETTNKERAAFLSPITCRWYESILAKNIVIGKKPKNPFFNHLFPDNFVQEININASDDILEDQISILWKNRQILFKNIYNSKNINFIDYDWCSRVVEILNIVD